MNSTLFTQTPFRQSLLKQQILNAFDIGQDEKFSLLQAQWVHRYGLETLPDLKEIRVNIEHSINLGESVDDDLVTQKTCLDQVEIEDFLDSPIDQHDQKNSSSCISSGILRDEIHEDDRNLNQDAADLEDSPVIKELDIENSSKILETSTNFRLKNKDNDKMVPTPPSPSLNHLRRWLPTVDHYHSTKAS